MTAEAQPAASTKPMPEAPTELSLWFPAAEWIRKYAWGTNLTPDLIAAISVAALLNSRINGLRLRRRRAGADGFVRRPAGADRSMLCSAARG